MFGRGKDKKAKPAKPKKEKKAKAKKAKPAKKAKAPKAKKSAPTKKRPTDIYAVLLMLSTGFVALAVIFLFLALTPYGFPGENMTPWK